MATIQKRGISLLLVLVLMLGMIPSVSAAEISTEPSTEPAETTIPVTEETQAAETSPPETTQPEETSPPETTQPEETTPTETVPSETEPTEVMLINEIATFAVTDCPSATWATIWVNTDEYSSVAGKTNRFIYYEFPSGTAKNRNNVGLKAIKVDGAWQAAYCLEPGIAEGSRYTTEEMTKDEFLSSSYVPDTLSTAQLEAMCIAALYGQHTLPQSSNYEDLSNMVATQIIIWEIAIGWRDCYPPYAQTNDAFIRRFKHAYGVGPEATSSYITIGGRLQTVIDCYDEISANMAAHDESILSFASRSSSRAPTIELTPDGTGKYTITALTEHNELYFVKGNNPMCIYHYPAAKLYVYASTEEILKKAMLQAHLSLGKPEKISLFSGEILRIDTKGKITRSHFDDSHLCSNFSFPWTGWDRYETVKRPYAENTDYLDDLKSVAVFYGLFPEDIDALIEDGVDPMEIEEMLYCG